MEPVVCRNWSSIETVWANHHGADTRWQQWLHRNLRNYLQRTVSQGTIGYGSVPAKATVCLGLDHQICLSPRDILLANSRGATYVNYISLDMYALPEPLRQHYDYGGIIYSWDVNTFAEHIQQLTHLHEALTATQKRSDFSVITIPQAQKIAEDWVEELNRRAVESGGTTEVVWRCKTAKTVDAVVTDENFDKLPAPETLVANWEMHLLLDQPSYQAEGQAMKHCVATYWGSKCKIYSLRCDGQRKATLEINERVTLASDKPVCSQIRGFKNAAPDQQTLDVVNKFLDNNGIEQPNQAFLGVAMPDRNLAYVGALRGGITISNHLPVSNHVPMGNLANGISAQGRSLFEYIRNLDVSAVPYGERPEITITGTPSPEGLQALQALWNAGR